MSIARAVFATTAHGNQRAASGCCLRSLGFPNILPRNPAHVPTIGASSTQPRGNSHDSSHGVGSEALTNTLARGTLPTLANTTRKDHAKPLQGDRILRGALARNRMGARRPWQKIVETPAVLVSARAGSRAFARADFGGAYTSITGWDILESQ